MNYQPYHGRCCVCDAPENRARPVKGFCYVHEPYSGAGKQSLAIARAAHLLDEQRAEMEARRDRESVRIAQGDTGTARRLEWLL